MQHIRHCTSFTLLCVRRIQLIVLLMAITNENSEQTGRKCSISVSPSVKVVNDNENETNVRSTHYNDNIMLSLCLSLIVRYQIEDEIQRESNIWEFNQSRLFKWIYVAPKTYTETLRVPKSPKAITMSIWIVKVFGVPSSRWRYHYYMKIFVVLFKFTSIDLWRRKIDRLINTIPLITFEY